MKKNTFVNFSIYVVTFMFMVMAICTPIEAKPIATVNGTEIELENFQILTKGHSDPRLLLDQIIQFILLAEKAQKENYKKDEVLTERIELLKKQQLIQFFQRKKLESKAELTEKELESLIPPYGRKKVDFQNIVVKTKGEADQIIELLKKGKDFAELAKQKSIAENKMRGGRIGFVTMDTGYFEGEISSEDEKSLFQLNDGQWSSPIKTRRGYAIYKAVSHEQLTPQDLENKKRYLRFKLQNKRVTEAQENLIKELQGKVTIKRIEKNIKALEKADKIGKEHLSLELAKVGDHPIKLEDLLMGQSAYNQLDSPFLKQPSFLNKRMDEVINLYLFYEEAKRLGYDKDKTYLNLMKINEATIIGQDYAMIKLMGDLPVTEKEMRDFYNENKSLFLNAPERVQLQSIFLHDEQEAKEVLQRLKAGADFSATAVKYSKDPSVRYTRGEAGFIPLSQLQNQGPEFNKALENLEVGKLSTIIKTNNGYYIIKLLDHKAEGASEFEDVKTGVEKYVKLQKLQSTIAELKSKAKITIDNEALNKIVEAAPKTPNFQPPQGQPGATGPPPPPRTP
ncbi:MAG: peptidylprolyl isomerase [bacterium]